MFLDPNAQTRHSPKCVAFEKVPFGAPTFHLVLDVTFGRGEIKQSLKQVRGFIFFVKSYFLSYNNSVWNFFSSENFNCCCYQSRRLLVTFSQHVSCTVCAARTTGRREEKIINNQPRFNVHDET